LLNGKRSKQTTFTHNVELISYAVHLMLLRCLQQPIRNVHHWRMIYGNSKLNTASLYSSFTDISPGNFCDIGPSLGYISPLMYHMTSTDITVDVKYLWTRTASVHGRWSRCAEGQRTTDDTA